MAFRWRKSIRILPGVRLNVSKSGISSTLGPRGASVNYTPTAAPPKKGWLKMLIWANVIGWGGLLLFGVLFHALFAGDKKWKHPVMVRGSLVNIRDGTDSNARVLTQVSAGDTLELSSLDFPVNGWAGVLPRRDRGEFPGGDGAAFIQRKFLLIPDSTLRRAKKETLLH